MQFNLSQWSLTHRSFTIYCMIALVLAGTLSYLRLGRNKESGLYLPHHGRICGLARRGPE